MIRHIFKIIWNERRTNSWIVIEFVLVFTVLWFCTDFLYNMTVRYLQDTGYDIKHTYSVKFAHQKSTPELIERYEKENARYEDAMTIVDRIMKYPGVESVSLSETAVPYEYSYSGGSYLINADTVAIQLRIKKVTASFFDVFKIKPVSGQLFSNDNPTDRVIISSKDGEFLETHPTSEVTQVKVGWGSDQNPMTVMGIVNTPMSNYIRGPENSIFFNLKKEEINISHNQLALRVSPNADVDFAEKFMEDMREQLNVGEYYLASIESGKSILKKVADMAGISNNVKSTLSITAFLLVNIFLGTIGTFWFLTQSRRSEIGLRIALGSSKRKVTGWIIGETLIILLITSVIATVICVNVSMTDLLESMGLPVVARPEDAPVDYLRQIINYVITFGVLALISVAAVWYPASQAAKVQPADALRDE